MSLPLAIRVDPLARVLNLTTDVGNLRWKRRFSAKPAGGDWNTAATTVNKDIVFPGGIRIVRAYISLITPFSGGSVSAATLSIGTTAGPTVYLGATNVFTGASSSGAVTFGAGASLGNFLGGNATPTALGTIRFQLITTTDNASSLTAGAVDVFLELAADSVRTT